MKKILILLLFVTNLCHGQKFGIRHSSQSNGIQIICPVNTLTKGEISIILTKENDRHLVYTHYLERLEIKKWISLFGGVGVHMGNRYVLNYKQNGNTIFLAGASVMGGVKFDLSDKVYLSSDMSPRVDFPFFGGCYMHKHCGEASFGNVNFSLGINLR